MKGGEIYFRDRAAGGGHVRNSRHRIALGRIGHGIPITPATGKLLIFPSWLEHRVEVFGGDGERISIAFNASNP